MEGIRMAHHSTARPIMLCEFELIKSVSSPRRQIFLLSFFQGRPKRLNILPVVTQLADDRAGRNPASGGGSEVSQECHICGGSRAEGQVKKGGWGWLPEFTCQAGESGLCPAALEAQGGLEVGSEVSKLCLGR